MLVCSISQSAARRPIAADIAEIVAALDVSSIGIIFETLVDDPASGNDIVNALVGEIMLEAASAIDAPDAGGGTFGADLDEGALADDIPDATYVVGMEVNEPATADDIIDALVPATYNVDVDETASATDAPDASVPVTYAADVAEAASANDAPDAGFKIRGTLLTQQTLFNYSNTVVRTSLVTQQVLENIPASGIRSSLITVQILRTVS